MRFNAQHAVVEFKHSCCEYVRATTTPNYYGNMPTKYLLTVIIWCFLILPCEFKICGDVIVRNNIKHIENKLRNCTIINGKLCLALMENNRKEDFEKYSFPELLEIRDSFIVFRVINIKSIGAMFPNLKVIRGNHLFDDYSFVLHNVSIDEIGLYNLQKIERGSVWINSCPNLCYAKTVNWTRLGTRLDYMPPYTDFLSTCKNCPSECKEGCWSATQCQNTKDVQKCIWNDEECVEKCPPNKYFFRLNNTCITKEGCALVNDSTSTEQWFIFNGTCTNKCPKQHTNVTEKEGWCSFCGDKCKIVCDGRNVTSISNLETLSDCTHINGSLRITVPSEIMLKELEIHLSEIREISGLLKVYRSRPLQNFQFLKNLKLIKGEELENNNSLIVYDNVNLNQLWRNHTIKILKGHIFFHLNRKICLSEIEQLAKENNMSDFDNVVQVSPYTNGDQTNCNAVTINMEIIEINSTNVTLKWNDARDKDWYYIYYQKVLDDEEISEEEYEGDISKKCVKDNWSVLAVENATIYITNLKPYTNYTYYLLFSKNSSRVYSKSKMDYFHTLSDDPSGPLDVTSKPSMNSIRISWKPPAEPQGVLSHYLIVYYEEPENQTLVDQRNYCFNKPTSSHTVSIKPSVETNGTCKCPPKPKTDVLQDVLQDVFEFFCSNLLEDSDTPCKSNNLQNLKYDTLDEDFSIEKRDGLQRHYKEVIVAANETHVDVENLKHFTTYIFLVSACNVNRTIRRQCSEVIMTYNRTLKDPIADDIIDLNLNYGDNRSVELKWNEPKNPNGVIVAYEIDYENKDFSNEKSQFCITRRQHEKEKFYIISPTRPGKFSVKVRAISLAASGRYSEELSFEIAEKPNYDLIISVICILILVVVIITTVYFYKKLKKRHEHEMFHLITSINPDYAGPIYIEDEWEIPREDLEVNKKLGNGTFGMVYSGFIKSKKLPCAIKTINQTANINDKNEFLNEASIMKTFSDAHHVVKLLGVVSRGESPFVVMELMGFGDLKEYLRRSRDSSQSITCNEMYRMAIEIADGMGYLAAKKFIHRDLAARNCMVSADRTVKIGDFGMARDIYETDYYRKETKGLLPVRWMAPESLADGVFTTDSDVWSYGVVLWEMITLAEQPYQGLSNEQVLQFVIAHGTLERPPECPDLLYEIMEVCWKWRPNNRPLFTDIVKKLENHVGENFRLVSFYHSREGEEYRMNAIERPLNLPAISANHDNFVMARFNVSEENLSLYSGDHDDYHSYPDQRPRHLGDYRLSSVIGNSRYPSFPMSPK